MFKLIYQAVLALEMHLKMASSAKSDDLVSQVVGVNDVDLKKNQRPQVGEGEQDSDRMCRYPNNWIQMVLWQNMEREWRQYHRLACMQHKRSK